MSADVGPRVALEVDIRREPRARCALCHLRRVLYRIVVDAGAGEDVTEARCAPCWGIAP